MRETIGIQVIPTLEEMETVQEYIKKSTETSQITDLQLQKIAISVDEIFSNIVNHNQANFIQVISYMEKEKIIIIFLDDGFPFNPLEEEASCPNPLKAGGLGILITKDLMDDLTYQYKNGMNQLTMILDTRWNEK